MGPDGKIYWVKRGTPTKVNVFNPLDRSFSTISFPAEIADAIRDAGPSYTGAVCAPNGKIYFSPFLRGSGGPTSWKIIVLTLGDTSPSYSVSGGLPEEEEAWSALLSPHINFGG